MGWLLRLLLASVPANAGGSFLIMSSWTQGKVGYVFLPEWGVDGVQTPKNLVDANLNAPMGIAVDQRKPPKLLVCDGDQSTIFKYNLKIDGDNLSVDGDQNVLVEGVQSRMIAVDGVGNIFFSNEATHQILKISAAKFLKDPKAPPEVVYDGASVHSVSAPGGVAVDNFHVFWSNKDSGTLKGSVVRASENPSFPSDTASVVKLQQNSAKVFGVCLARDNVFYTAEEKYIYGVKQSGGEFVTIASNLQQPRGCAWNGDGSVFVADKLANAVYSFAGNMHSLAPVELTEVAKFDGVFGLAVLTGMARLPGAILSIFLVVGVSCSSTA